MFFEIKEEGIKVVKWTAGCCIELPLYMSWKRPQNFLNIWVCYWFVVHIIMQVDYIYMYIHVGINLVVVNEVLSKCSQMLQKFAKTCIIICMCMTFWNVDHVLHSGYGHVAIASNPAVGIWGCLLYSPTNNCSQPDC